MRPEIAVAVFAKFPSPGAVKTRLTQGSIPGLGTLSLEQAAALYRAFLLDIRQRFVTTSLPLAAHFCVRPGPHLEAFREAFAAPELPVIEEPTEDGRRAASIGEAMAFALRWFLQRGYRGAIILGSDAPHLPDTALEEAVALLAEHPLVLGNDGGGCYLVGASASPEILEDPAIPWSQGRDFAALCALQRQRGATVGVLAEVITDIDTPADLLALVEALQAGEVEPANLPCTVAILRGWGLLSR